ncbi:NAD(P)-dependent oxidoreductase [bacterium]|nr:NAD(P)-dependent oxidoreductase [bacterium]
MNIAILGATSHIAKSLIFNFFRKEDVHLELYSRSLSKLLDFLGSIKKTSSDAYLHEGYSDFFENFHDVVINCVGVGTQNKLKGNYSLYFTVTEEYDNLVLDYLRKKNPYALYISFSSGAVYGREHTAPVEEHSLNHVKVNHVSTEDYYAIARLNAEAKHRSYCNLKIIDLRLFSYFSRFIDLNDGYLITEVVNSILNKKVLITDNVNIVRDYLNPKDLFSIIRKCMNAGKINGAFDVTSSKAVEKWEILDLFSSKYGLKYEVGKTLSHASPTGTKNIYCSEYNSATTIGYTPEFSSIDTMEQEAKYILT